MEYFLTTKVLVGVKLLFQRLVETFLRTLRPRSRYSEGLPSPALNALAGGGRNGRKSICDQNRGKKDVYGELSEFGGGRKQRDDTPYVLC